MKRRDLLKLIPVTTVGIAASSIESRASILNSGAEEPFAEVKMYNGTPTFFLDGKPAHFSGMWVSSPTPEHWGHRDWSFEHPGNGNSDSAQRMAKTGTHIYAFGVGEEWCGPKQGLQGHFDFSKVEASFRQILKTDPEARLHLRIQLEKLDGWWDKVYPDECEVTTEGKKPEQSYASLIWQNEAKEFLKQYVEHIQKIGLEKKVIAYQVLAGQSGEWTKWASSGTAHCGDYSKPMQRHFQNFLRKKYNNDPAILKKAWNNPQITFESAQVPSQEQQLSTTHYDFRDPRLEQNVIDYFTCHATLCADLIHDFCKVIKDATRNRAMAGVFYGYTLNAPYNQDFFGEKESSFGGNTGEGNKYSKIQRDGHLAFMKVLQSPYVDFVVSPVSYGFRSIGGDGLTTYLTESVRLHGKLGIVEDDIRLHDAPQSWLKEPLIYGRTRSFEESISIIRRDFSRALVHGQGIWRAPVADAHLYPELERFNKLGAFALQLDRKPCAEVAVIVDEESMRYETPKYNLNLASISNQIYQGVARMGAASDFYFLDDLIDGKLPPYKLYLFLNAYQLDQTRRNKLRAQIQRDHRTALWIYAPGYLKDAPALENMSEITGFKFAMGQLPWPVFMHLTDFTHPITKRVPQDLFWNYTAALGPLFSIDDKEAKILGEIVFSQGSCVPGLGVKTFPNWTSIYSAMPFLPAPVLRGIARNAGVHLYNEEGDVIYASKDLLCVHTVSGGKRTFNLPQKTALIYDLFEEKKIGENLNRFEVNLRPGSTNLYYTGKSVSLKK
jgi:hypothetical protein